uniref:Cytochrome c oxidase subunit 3 n=1 Tax=Leptopilina syphax TaxID=2755057 RepID=A0A7D6JWT3_9HYME|nr:cytochrome c oxidase subunit III [Leptopilina syphax]
MMKMLHNLIFHLVTVSPWPILSSFSVMSTMIGGIMLFNDKFIYLMNLGFLSIILCSIQWWRDVIREGTFQGSHLSRVVEGLKLGMVLFILSEVMFFLSFFWTFFHSSLSPNIEVGGIWPPSNILQFDPFQLPLLNTVILLSSGVLVTWSHYSILNSDNEGSQVGLLGTIMLGMVFSMIQFMEYYEATFSMSDSVFGSIFFLTTGFHGGHVIIGSIFLLVILIRLSYNHLNKFHHFGFEAASWYWHFVDVVWIFVYILVYWWHW